MIYRYAKIPYPRAVELGLEKIRRRISSGEVIINESDLLTYGDDDPFESKVQGLGGTVLTALQAKQEIDKSE